MIHSWLSDRELLVGDQRVSKPVTCESVPGHGLISYKMVEEILALKEVKERACQAVEAADA